MSVVSILETPLNRQGETSTTIDDAGMDREWQIIVDSRSDNYFTIISDPLYQETIPLYLDAHPADSRFTVRNVSLVPQNALQWFARAKYSTSPISQESKDQNQIPDPFLRPLRFSIDSVEFQEYRDQDADGKDYINSALEPYAAQVHDVSRPVIRMRMNISDYSTSWFTLNNTVNQSAVTMTDGVATITVGSEVGLLKAVKMGELQVESDIPYYEITGEIHIKDDADKWKTFLIDKGMCFLDPDTNGELTRFKVKDPDTGDMVPAVTEQLLDGSGGQLYTDNKPDGSKTIQYNEFRKHKLADWSGLPFFY